jgi:hypothetical protein
MWILGVLLVDAAVAAPARLKPLGRGCGRVARPLSRLLNSPCPECTFACHLNMCTPGSHGPTAESPLCRLSQRGKRGAGGGGGGGNHHSVTTELPFGPPAESGCPRRRVSAGHLRLSPASTGLKRQAQRSEGQLLPSFHLSDKTTARGATMRQNSHDCRAMQLESGSPGRG